MEMGEPQFLHLPRNRSHEKIGTLSCAEIGMSHVGQADRGDTTDSLRGTR